MRKLFITLFAALALPTAVNAETMPITQTQLLDIFSFGGLDGSLRAICYAEKKGFLSNNEKLEMINTFTGIYKEAYEDKIQYIKDKEKIFSGLTNLLPNCLP